jgi:hypothetical protein
VPYSYSPVNYYQIAAPHMRRRLRQPYPRVRRRFPVALLPPPPPPPSIILARGGVEELQGAPCGAEELQSAVCGAEELQAGVSGVEEVQ